MVTIANVNGELYLADPTTGVNLNQLTSVLSLDPFQPLVQDTLVKSGRSYIYYSGTAPSLEGPLSSVMILNAGAAGLTLFGSNFTSAGLSISPGKFRRFNVIADVVNEGSYIFELLELGDTQATAADVLKTARQINGVSFNGSANITVPAAGSTLTDTVPVSKGGTGNTTATAYAPLFGGTTTTGAFQSGTVGTAGQVLTSNGASALPTFQAAAGGSISTITGLGTGVATALAVNLGTTGSPALRLISSDTKPALLNRMDEWYDSATGARFVNYDSQWVEVSGAAYPSNGSKAQDNPPTLPNVGDLWYDTSVGSLYVYLNGAWVEAQGNAIDSAGIIAALGYTPLANNGNISTLTGTGFFNVNGTIGATVPTTAAFTSVTSTAYTNIPGQTTVTSISAAGNTALSVFATDTIKTFIVPVSAGAGMFTATVSLNVSAPVPQNGTTTVVKVSLPASANPRIQLRSNVTVIGEAVGNGIARDVIFRCVFNGTSWDLVSRTPSCDTFTFLRSSAPSGATWDGVNTWSWSWPVGARTFSARMCGAGGGGGSGRRGAPGVNTTGGSGGGGGQFGLLTGIVPPNITNFRIGAGGAGGSAITTDDTNGNPGVIGGETRIQNQTTSEILISIAGGNPGQGGISGTTIAGGGSDTYRIDYGIGGAAGTNVAGAGSAHNFLRGGPGGGGGGGLDTSNTERAGGGGGRAYQWWGGGEGSAGTAGGGAGGVGINHSQLMYTGHASGGGGSAAAAAGGAGGAGGLGSGAGGGGASRNGFNSGAGGVGGDGFVVIQVFF